MISPKNRFGSIRRRIVWKLTVLVVVHLIVLTSVSGILGVLRETREVDQRLASQTRELLNRIELRLSFFVERSRDFVASSHVTNSLIDPSGRGAYLPAAVQDFAKSGEIASVTVVDFAGEVVEKSANASNWGEIDVSDVLANRTTILFPAPAMGRILVVAPITYYDTALGAVIVEVDLTTAIKHIANVGRDTFVRFVATDRDMFKQSKPEAEYRTVEQAADATLPHLYSIGATAFLGMDKAKVMAPAWAALREAIGIGAIAVILSVLLAWKIGSRLAAPVSNLSDRVRRGVHPCGPTGTNDELEALAYAFDEQTHALIEASEELEQRVDERTASLAAKTLQLERSNEELDEFAYIASHDLKEPLRGIHNYSQFLLEDYADKLNEEGESKLRTLCRLSQRMEQLIDNLLHFSRLGRSELAIGEVNLNDVMGTLREDLAISLSESGLEIRIPALLPSVLCDRIRIVEVFRNFVTNAMKYNDKDRKWVEVGFVQQATIPGDPDDIVQGPVFYVRDNGIGIRDKHLGSIFRIFKRLHGRDKFGGGHGAGLTIAKKIIERHEGRVWVESTLNEGTTFWFHLGQPVEGGTGDFVV